MGPPFDPEIHKLSAQNALWLAVKDRDEWVVHTHTMRVLNLSSSMLLDHLEGSSCSFAHVGPDIDLAALQYWVGSIAEKIRSAVVYLGGLWEDGIVGALRTPRLSAVLGRFTFLACLMRLSPDYILDLWPGQ